MANMKEIQSIIFRPNKKLKKYLDLVENYQMKKLEILIK